MAQGFMLRTLAWPSKDMQRVKLKEVKDLFQVESLGFRGEALASIASVSIIELVTRTAEEDMGIRIEMAGGKTNHTEATGSPQGTTVVVKDLFLIRLHG